MGDAAGIGPELVIRAFKNKDASRPCSLFVIGSLRILQRAADALNEHMEFRSIESFDRNTITPDSISVLECKVKESPRAPWGLPDAANGANAVAQMKKAVELALADSIDDVVIAPLHKEAMQMAGFPFPDEIKFLGSLTGTDVRTVVT